MKRYIVRQIGQNKGAPRVYLDLPELAQAGFEPGKTYNRVFKEDEKRITLSVEPNGTHVVSKKERTGKADLSIIDINSSEALKMFEGMQAVRIVLDNNKVHILPLASESKRIERLQRLKQNLDSGEISTASLSHGGGVLDHAAHTGLKSAGVNARLAMANEIDESLLAHASEHNDIWDANTIGIAAPMQELVQDDWAMRKLPKVDLLAAGIPCSGASQAGKSKRGLSMMEDHPEVGGLMASAIMVINRIQPAVCVIENVEGYAHSASAQILRHYLRDAGYDVQETVLGAQDFGCLENRVRWFLVAATRGIEIDLQSLAPILRPVHTLAEMLDDIAEDAPDWRTFDYLKVKEGRDAAKGNSFAMQTVSPTSTSVPVLRKGYAKGGSTDPLLVRPSNPDLLRQLTVAEHARIKGVPPSLVEGLSKTDGHILLGQGIAYAPVEALFRRIGECLMKWKASFDSQHTQSIGYSLMRATG